MKGTQNLESVVIFSKKELVLIFLFMVLVAITSFAIGIKIGRNVSHEKMGITASDRESVELKSQKEEDVENVIEQLKEHEAPPAEQQIDESYQKLKEEFKKMNEEAVPSTPTKENGAPKSEQAEGELADKSPEAASPLEENGAVKKEEKILKYTIQLGSYQYKEDAVRFADGFRIRGYNPIIREVPLGDKGVWYRVALGTFENVAEAKKYIENEESLFAGQDYIITEF